MRVLIDELKQPVAMRRRPIQGYEIETFLTPLKTVARETKHMDPSYIENGNNITKAFIDYLLTPDVQTNLLPTLFYAPVAK